MWPLQSFWVLAADRILGTFQYWRIFFFAVSTFTQQSVISRILFIFNNHTASPIEPEKTSDPDDGFGDFIQGPTSEANNAQKDQETCEVRPGDQENRSTNSPGQSQEKKGQLILGLLGSTNVSFMFPYTAVLAVSCLVQASLISNKMCNSPFFENGNVWNVI